MVVRSSVVFLLLVFFVLQACAKKMEGAGSASVPPSVSESLQAMPPPSDIYDQVEAEKKTGFRIAFGASNLRPYFAGVYFGENTSFGFGVGGILFSGLTRVYNVVTGDLSFITKRIKGRYSFMGLGAGLGGAYAHDENWSRRGQRTYLMETHAYGQMHIGWKLPGSPLGVSLNFKLGGYYVRSPIFITIAQELKAAGEENVKETERLFGLYFTPSFGINWTMVDGKILSYVGLMVPLTSALIFEPYLHPYVPSFNFIFVF